MNIIIYRGSHEIGGSCVEVCHKGTRLIIDIGMPLIASDGGRFRMHEYDKLSGPELVRENVLPNLSGFYSWDLESKPVNALLISHAHFDHYGFINYLRNDIKCYVGEGARRLMRISDTFSKNSCAPENSHIFKSNIPFKVGTITVTPYIADHSAFDSYSFLLEAEGKRLLYTGDFREHGRKINSMHRLIKAIPKNIDAILLEGTLVERNGGLQKSECNIENDFYDLLNTNSSTVFVAASGQNIDRMVSIYRAAKRAGRILVIDPYIANILDSLSDLAKLPHPSPQFPDIRVYFPTRFCNWLKKMGNEKLFKRFALYKITREELHEKRGQIVMLIRPSTIDYVEKMKDIDGTIVVWSQWEGYLKDDTKQMRSFFEFIKKKKLVIKKIHTSGHASVDTMKKLVSSINPKSIIPIHTSNPDRYSDLFPNIPIAKITDGVAVLIED